MKIEHSQFSSEVRKMLNRSASAPLFLTVLLVASVVGTILLKAPALHAVVSAQYGSTCSDCHGLPPTDSFYRNITTGSFRGNHSTHALGFQSSCVRCHQQSGTYSFSHMTSIVVLTDNINNSPAIARYVVDGAPASFLPRTSAPVFGTCSNVDCHFEKSTPQWGSPVFSGTADCSRCHAAPPEDGNHLSHAAYYGPGVTSCSQCHPDHTAEAAPFAHATSAGKRALTIRGFTYSKPENLAYPAYLPSQAPVRNGTCSSNACHDNTAATWGSVSACLDCHSVSQGNRAAITPQFSANSHHIQGTITNGHCYQCHWEANSDGSINTAYHGSKVSGSPVDLVIYGSGTRPTTYTAGVTAVTYNANGSRAQIAKVSTHCLGCHCDANNGLQPFGDGKTPRQYAWDGTSIAARYSQTGTTTWGKFSTVTNAAQKRIAKAYSAHGNASANKRGWSTSTGANGGVDGVISDTSGIVNVECFDCHNSHGSSVTGRATRYVSATVSGGILKDTSAGTGGYLVSYRPYTGGTTAAKNKRNPGASLCLDCHLNASAGTRPWGYNSTFNATQHILGYNDPLFMGYSGAGVKMRYTYKSVAIARGGHFGASSPLTGAVMGSIDGLCTPCHDPHGVSPTLGADKQYAVPLLKGTWITSPYKEDVAPVNNAFGTDIPGYGEGVKYHIDQNTFGATIRSTVTGVTQTVAQSGGLCLTCHPQTSLTFATTPAAPNAWKGKNRVHESVKGWKTSNGVQKHSYTCSKCHSPHSTSTLPRLMVTNCLDSRHKGRVKKDLTARVISNSSSGTYGGGSGHTPGSYSGDGSLWNSWGVPAGLSPPYYNTVTCHDSATANGGGSGGTLQRWNNVTPWVYP